MALELTGKVFGRLIVLSRAPNKGKRSAWLCRCECGREVVVAGTKLVHDKQRGCGCKKGNPSHRMCDSAEYQSWQNAVTRCTNPKRAEWHRYGGRGIKVCERWQKFESFYADMGPKPGPEYTLDRIDNDGNYEPGNCRWVTRKEQSLNYSRNIVFEGLTCAEWASYFGVTYSVVHHRLKTYGTLRKHNG